ncbi:unnamed protein product [Prunus armeniaca]
MPHEAANVEIGDKLGGWGLGRRPPNRTRRHQVGEERRVVELEVLCLDATEGLRGCTGT